MLELKLNHVSKRWHWSIILAFWYRQNKFYFGGSCEQLMVDLFRWILTHTKSNSYIFKPINDGMVYLTVVTGAIWCQWSRPTLFQVMAYLLFSFMPFPKPVMIMCQLNLMNQTNVSHIFINLSKYSFSKMYLYMSYEHRRPFCMPQCIDSSWQ